MKTLSVVKSSLAVMALAASASAFAHQSNELASVVKFVGDTQYSGFCRAIVENDVSSLRAKASRHVGQLAASQRGVIRVVSGENGVTCNGLSLIEFSEQKNADDVLAYLVARS